jgi:3-methyladenine DNA glycosylase AlkD
MTTAKARTGRPRATPGARTQALRGQVQGALAWLEGRGSRKRREEMGPRYGVQTDKAFGVSIADIQRLGKKLGPSHELAAALWATGFYEARLLATFVEVPALVTSAQMDRWCRDFDNWGICDTACFHLFDRIPHAFPKVAQWSRNRGEFVRRAAFALLACLALHDKNAPDEPFIRSLAWIEAAGPDPRNFVKKGVSWALRAVGERNARLNAAAVASARRMAASAHAAAAWVGKDALRQLTRSAVTRRLAAASSGIQARFQRQQGRSLP